MVAVEKEKQEGLQKVISSSEILVCMGSGGVGKTTTSAAIALQAAMDGKRVLCLTVDPARRLANSLGLEKMTSKPQLISEEWFSKFGVVCKGSLEIMMVDSKEMFDGLIEKYVPEKDSREKILDNRFYQELSTSLAGTLEYMAIEALYAAREEKRWDLIVLDTPPTTNALDFLNAPERMISAVDSPAMRWFMQMMRGKQVRGLRFLGRSASFLFGQLSRFTGTEFLKKIAELIELLSILFDGLRERSESVSKLLREPFVSFILVGRPDISTLEEVGFLKDTLESMKLRSEILIINGVQPKVEAFKTSETALQEELVNRFGCSDEEATSVSSKLRELHQRGLRLSERDRRILSDFEGRKTNQVQIRVPLLDEDVHDLLGLKKIGDFLMHSS